MEEIDAKAAPASLLAADLVIDAAYGTGLPRRAPCPRCVGAPVLAVDIPSGIDGTTGEDADEALTAVRTVTFAALKPGLVLEPGALEPARSRSPTSGSTSAQALAGWSRPLMSEWLPPRPSDSHKWSAGVLRSPDRPG